MANLRFYHGAFPTENTDAVKEGMIYFSPTDHTIAVGTSDKKLEKYYGGKVANVTFNETSKVLTITYNDGTTARTLDFSDTASASGVNSLFLNLRSDINDLQKSIGVSNRTGESGTSGISYEGTNYISDKTSLKDADVALDAQIKAVADKVGDDSVLTQISTAIGALNSSKSQTAGDDGLALSITLTDGKVTAFSGSIAADTYDEYGAAAAVLGDADDTKDDATVYGALAAAAAAETAAGQAAAKVTSEIQKLDATIDNGDSQTDGIKVQIVETDGKLTSVSVTSGIKSALIGSDDDTSAANTIKGAKAMISEEIEKLDLAQVGAAGSYIKYVSEANGQVSATKQAFLSEITVDAESQKASETNAPTAEAVRAYVATSVADLAGAMHFAGVFESLPAAASYKAGDVIIVGTKEYILSDKTGASQDVKGWVELGDEGAWEAKGTVAAEIQKLDAEITSEAVDGQTVKVTEVDGKITAVEISSTLKTDLIGKASGEGASTSTSNTIEGAKRYADAAKEAVLGTSTSTLGAAEGRISALETKMGTDSVATQITNAINELDTPEAGVSGSNNGVSVTVKQVNGVVDSVEVAAPDFANTYEPKGAEANAKGYADGLVGALDLTQVGAAGSYIQLVSQLDGQVSATAQTFDAEIPASNASSTNAPTTSAVKTYVDNQVGAKNVSAEGDNVFIAASAKDNKVSVAGTYAEMSVSGAEGTTTKDGIVKGSVMKSYVDDMLTWVNF